MIDVSTIVAALLGGGGVAFITAVFRGVGSLRSGARAREKEAVDDLGRWRDELDNQRRLAEWERDHYHRVATKYAAQLIRAGINPDPPSAEPPPPPVRRRLADPT